MTCPNCGEDELEFGFCKYCGWPDNKDGEMSYATAEGQKRMMAESMGLPSDTYIRTVNTAVTGDYGADPLGEGKFRMVPSGDIVDYEERCRRLKP